jgi:DNA-binding MarR family transcriptional regulator
MTEPTQFPQSLRGWMDTFVHRSMRDSVRFVKASGFSMPQFLLLMHLHHREYCGISDLSEHMEISAAAASQLVDKLVQAELLVRTEDPDDRRAKQVALSPKGKELIEQSIEERYRWVDEIAKALSEEEKIKVAEALEILNEMMKRVESRG